MAKKRAGPRLAFHQLTAARRSYEGGQTFAAIAERYGLSEAGMRRLLRSVGVEVRSVGRQPAEIPALALEDARAGLSAHQIAKKHGLPRHRLNDALRELGLARAPRQRILVPIGRKLTDRQAVLRRMPPLRIRVRSPEERRRGHWLTSAERAAVEYEIAAGRYRAVARGTSGFSGRSWKELYAAMQAAQFQQRIWRRAIDAMCPRCLIIPSDGICGCQDQRTPPGARPAPEVARAA